MLQKSSKITTLEQNLGHNSSKTLKFLAFHKNSPKSYPNIRLQNKMSENESPIDDQEDKNQLKLILLELKKMNNRLDKLETDKTEGDNNQVFFGN